jgi:glyoxylase-like metal-dependent hydrolase (beta-lactamase superfamily II)
VITSIDDAAAIAAEALAKDAPRWEAIALRYGTRMTTRAAVYHEYEQHGEPDAPLGMDYFFWFLRSAVGTILVDSGFDGEVGARRGRTTVCPPLEALRRLGVTPDTVDLIVLTHLHYDHTGHLGEFPDTELVIQQRDLAFWQGPGAEGGHAMHVERDEVEVATRAAAAGRVRLLEGGGVVAPGVGAVLVGGHSPGQMALVVNGREGPVLLVSDAVHYYEELERRLQFAIFTDLAEMVAGYGLLESLAERTRAVLVPGHDPEVVNRFPPVSDELAGVALRLG